MFADPKAGYGLCTKTAMRFPYVLLIALASACTSRVDDTPGRLAAAEVRNTTLYVAIATQSTNTSTTIDLDVAAPSTTDGVTLCPGKNVEGCTKGLGLFHTTDHHRDLGGQKIFRTNVKLLPATGLELTVVAHDARGAATAASVIRLEAR